MKGFTLEIRSPEKEIFLGRIKSLKARALDGEIGILADHAPLATVLDAGKIDYTLESGEAAGIDLKSGFLIAGHNQATVLLER